MKFCVNAPTSAWVERSCPVCEASESVPHLEKPGLRIVRCARCAMLFANPIRREMAAGAYYEALAEPFYLSRTKLEADYAPVRFLRELRLFRRFCPAGAVLDVGCSTGAFLFHLNRSAPGCYQVCGTDVSCGATDYARSRGIEIVAEPFLEHDYGQRKFHAVTFWAVMEHLVEPCRFLKKAAALLLARGHVFLLVPNMRSLAARLLGSRYRYLLPEHINYFTSTSFAALVSRVPDVEVIAGGTMHLNPLVIWEDLRKRERPVEEKGRAALLERTTRYKQNPWLGPVKLAYHGLEKALAALGLADNLYFVLRKPAACAPNT